jgi:hypothetical protein
MMDEPKSQMNNNFHHFTSVPEYLTQHPPSASSYMMDGWMDDGMDDGIMSATNSFH